MVDPVEKPPPPLASEVFDASENAGAPASVVEADLICRGCGYNLRGLSTTGQCPECGARVAHALYGDYLRYSDPAWVRTVARGFRLQSAAVATGLLAIIFAAASRESLGLPWLTLAIALFVGAFGLIGVWLATSREPAAADIERWFSNRRMLRLFTVLGVSLQGASGFFVLLWPGAGLHVRLVAAAAMIIGILYAFRHAVGLAERIPDFPLVAETNGVMWGLIVSYGVFLAILALALSGGGGGVVSMVAFSLSCIVIVACVVFTLWSLTLFSRYAAALRLAAIDAEFAAAPPH